MQYVRSHYVTLTPHRHKCCHFLNRKKGTNITHFLSLTLLLYPSFTHEINFCEINSHVINSYIINIVELSHCSNNIKHPSNQARICNMVGHEVNQVCQSKVRIQK